jgi:hypothetical protein
MKYSRFFIFTFVFLLTTLAIVGTARAAAHSWSGGGADRLASDAQNWEGSVVPVSGDAVTLPSGTVSWDLSGIVPSAFTTAANLTLSSPLIVSGALNINGGSLDLGGQALNIGADLNISGGVLTIGVSPVNVSGNWNVTGGSVSLLAGTVTLNGSMAKTITSNGQHFGGLTIAAANGSVALSDDLNVDGALTVSDGSLSIGAKTATVAGGVVVSGGSLSIGNGTLELIGALGRPLNISGGSFVSGATSTVEYRPAAGAVAVEATTYGNLKLTGKNVFSLMDDTTVAGTLTIGADATLSLSGHALNVPGGSIDNAGNITDGVIRSPAASLRVTNASGADISTVRSSSGTINVTVADSDLNRHGTVSENVSMALTITTVGGDKETVNMQETAPASGIFTASGLVLHQAAPIQNNGQIEIGQNDIVFIKYADPQDPSDTKTVQVAVALGSAVSSGQPQIVDGPRIGDWSSTNTGSAIIYAAHITWSTDIESSSSVTVTSPQLTSPTAAGSLTGTTEHDVAVSGLIRGNSYSFTVSSMTADGKTVASQAKHFSVIVPGDRIKSAASSAVYWYLGGKRNVFSDPTSYGSWFSDFSGVVTVPADQLSDIALGHVVPVRAGTYLVKIQSDPKTYAVEPFGVLRWIPTEAQAIALYGGLWSKRVRDIDVSQFVNYSTGEALASHELPSGFVYKSGGNDLNIVLNGVAHPLSDYDRRVNGLALPFVNSVAPSTVASLSSGGAVNGYNSDLDGVLKDGSISLIAPAFGV